MLTTAAMSFAALAGGTVAEGARLALSRELWAGALTGAFVVEEEDLLSNSDSVKLALQVPASDICSNLLARDARLLREPAFCSVFSVDSWLGSLSCGCCRANMSERMISWLGRVQPRLLKGAASAASKSCCRVLGSSSDVHLALAAAGGVLASDCCVTGGAFGGSNAALELSGASAALD